MEEIAGALDTTIYGVTLYEWATLLLIGTGLSLGLLLVKRLSEEWLDHVAPGTSTQADDVILEFIRNTHGFFLTSLGFLIAMLIAGFAARAGEIGVRIFILLALLQAALWGNGLITWWIGRFRERKLETDAAAVTTIQAAGFIGRLVLFAVILLMTLDNLGIDVTTLIAGFGIAGIAVGLALQNVFGDLLASLSIVFDRPFVVGDFIIVDQYMGTVENIGLETTRIRSLGGEQIIFSNSDLIKSRIRNYKRMYERRILFSVGVTYQTPHEKLKEIPGLLREIVEAEEMARFDRAHFKGYGDFALQFEIVYYVLAPDYNIYMDTQQAINLGIHRAFEEREIEFAYPTQTLYVQDEADGQSPAGVPDTPPQRSREM